MIIIASSNSCYWLTVYDKVSEFCIFHGSLHSLIRRKRKIRTLLQSETGSDFSCLVGAGGFEPPKLKAADLQSVPIGHSGTRPYSVFAVHGLPVYITTRMVVCQHLLRNFWIFVPKAKTQKQKPPRNQRSWAAFWSWWQELNLQPTDYKSVLFYYLSIKIQSLLVLR